MITKTKNKWSTEYRGSNGVKFDTTFGLVIIDDDTYSSFCHYDEKDGFVVEENDGRDSWNIKITSDKLRRLADFIDEFNEKFKKN